MRTDADYVVQLPVSVFPTLTRVKILTVRYWRRSRNQQTVSFPGNWMYFNNFGFSDVPAAPSHGVLYRAVDSCLRIVLGNGIQGTCKQCCGSGPFFRIRIGSRSANPDFKIRIRIRLTQKRPDPTGSGSYLDIFLYFFMAFSYQI